MEKKVNAYKFKLTKKDIVLLVCGGFAVVVLLGCIFAYGSLTTKSKKVQNLYKQTVSLINADLESNNEDFKITKLLSFSYEDSILTVGAVNDDKFVSYCFDFTNAKVVPSSEDKLINKILETSYKKRTYSPSYVVAPIFTEQTIIESIPSEIFTGNSEDIVYGLGKDDVNADLGYFAGTFKDNEDNFYSTSITYSIQTHDLDIKSVSPHKSSGSKTLYDLYKYIISK